MSGVMVIFDIVLFSEIEQVLLMPVVTNLD